jgi:hypothetical protein
MADGAPDKLHALLFGDEKRQLENIRFWPGSDRGLTTSQLRAEAAEMIAAALAGNLTDTPPLSGRNKTSIYE